MELVRGLHNLNRHHYECVLTIGKFDGIHLGHQAVLKQVIQKARALNVPATVMVFEPQPEEFFAPSKAPARLTRLREKYTLLRELGVDRLICVKFDKKFSSQSAEYFVEHLLVNKLGVKYLVVGDDFRFGKGRVGDFAMLKQAGEQFGFDVVDTKSLQFEDARVSSSVVREALQQADFARVKAYLGRPYSISGKVIHGQKLGRSIGFPTANIPLLRCTVPVSGVFAVVVKMLSTRVTKDDADSDERTFLGVANVGKRPTVNGDKPQLEVHIFDLEADLYGKNLMVELHHKIRDEKKFDSFNMLKEQIILDAETAKKWLSQHYIDI
ncbi:bifunctional riboflavin kinase/FAD synthetase [Alteromonas sp. a30]|uniref:bifunctional riboflavin kinase/FAD synthetase n=1 Tax=Alteromonas sp. a30 TaxID=2730917 RepID=UPI00227FA06B|nr:bifunctional riboflavin kinase/FAD synthetase [Alteromonas sp. a30]MCY7295941.1 bifunctional riboflavin kinase/FAD synthetase [Alteromonas sp. a30]